MAFEIGIYNFGELTPNPMTGKLPDPAQRIEELIEQASVADKAGLDIFALGEHHRSDFAVSAPLVVLAAAAERTKKIRLSSSVTVLSSDDPVRVFQQHSTLDLISKGRAEMMVGRGSYIESFPLFGYDLNDYDELFEEKLGLLIDIQEKNPVTWSGKYRPALKNADIAPRSGNKIPIWVAVGGAPASVIRAASFGLPLALAIIGGASASFKPFVDLYRKTAKHNGFEKLAVSINSPGYLAKTREEAVEIAYPYFASGMLENFHERGHGIKISKDSFTAQSSLHGALFFGSEQDVIDKILYQYQMFGHQRFMMQLGFGNAPQNDTLKAIDLLGKKVAPAVRKRIAELEKNKKS